MADIYSINLLEEVTMDLPPLNPNLPHTVSVEVEPSYHKLHYDPKFSEPVFAIHTIVSVKYKSVDESNHEIFDVLSCKTKVHFPCHVTDSSPHSYTEIKRNFLDEIYIPFKFDKNSVASRILEVVYSMRQKISNLPFYNVLPLTLEITKEVELPDCLMQRWCVGHQIRKDLDPNFEKDYKRAISRPRTVLHDTLNSEEEEVDSGVEDPKIVSLEDDNSCSKSCCSICLDELVLGYDNTTTLRCSHIFHLDCIWKWKCGSKKGDTCPLCRCNYIMK